MRDTGDTGDGPVSLLYLLLGSAAWVQTALTLVAMRQEHGLPWHRMAMILGGLSLLTAVAALLLQTGPMKRLLHGARETAASSAAVFVQVAALLAVVQLVVPRPLLILERLLPGAGWVEVLLLRSTAPGSAKR